MNRKCAWILAMGLATTMARASMGAIEYLHIPGIPDGAGVPGFPGAMPVRSMTVTKGGFSITRATDAASVDLLNAVISGTPLGTTTVLLYKGPVTSTPNVEWRFDKTFATSLVAHADIMGTETATFSTSQPVSMYYNLPGITGSASRIDHQGIVPIVSLTMDAGTTNTFSISRLVDLSSPAIQADFANGTVLPTATLLLYDSDSPSARDYAELTFTGVLVSSYQTQGAGESPMEDVSFSYQDVSIQYTAVPEPATGLLMLTCSGVLLLRPRIPRHRRKEKM